MFPRILHQMRDLVRTSQYVITLHAHEEMQADGFTVFDVEHCVLTGEIVERQRDRRTADWKYLVQGDTLEGESMTTVAKIGPTGKLVVITVFPTET